MEKISNFDLKLLYELDKNSRQSYNQLAKKLRSNKNTIRYRVEYLKKLGIINKFLAIINLSDAGYFHEKVYLKLHKLTEKRKNELIDYVIENKDIVWAASCDGVYDFIISFRVKDLREFKLYLMDLLNKFDEIIKEKEITSLLEAEYLPMDYLINKERLLDKKVFIGKIEKNHKEIDEINQKILYFIAKDCKINILEIAEKLNLSAVAVASRMKKLEKEGFIQKYSILLNNEIINNLHYKVLIGLHNLNESKEETITNYLRRLVNVIYIVNSLGSWELEFDINVNNANKLREIINNLTNKFPDLIREYTTLQIYQIHKYNLFPKETLNLP